MRFGSGDATTRRHLSPPFVRRPAGDFVEQLLQFLVQPLIAGMIDRRDETAADRQPFVKRLQRLANQLAVAGLGAQIRRQVHAFVRRIGGAFPSDLGRRMSRRGLIALKHIQKPTRRGAGRMRRRPRRGKLPAADGVREQPRGGKFAAEVDKQLFLQTGRDGQKSLLRDREPRRPEAVLPQVSSSSRS